MFPGICVVTTIPCCDLALSSFAELCVATKFLYLNTVSVASHFDSRCDNFFWCPSVCVATTIPCHDTISVVSQFDPWSQPPFYVATSFLVFCLHASYNSKLLICLFSCRDMGIRSRQDRFFSYCNSCHDLKIMSRPFFLPILSQPHFFSHNSFYSIHLLFLVAT